MLRLIQPTAFRTPISLARSVMFPAMVLKAIRTATRMAIMEATRVNLSERANRLPSSFRNESGVPMVAFFPIMVRSSEANSGIFSSSAFMKIRLTSSCLNGETACTCTEEAARLCASDIGR